jgi:hypothetical protein
VPDFIRKIYGVNVVNPVNQRFNFLSRDNEDKEYRPGDVDRFVFRDFSSIELFKKSSLEIFHFLMKEWTDMNLPTIQDKDREVDVPDSELVQKWVLTNEFPSESMKRTVETRTYDISFIVSNVEIVSKAAVLRTIQPAWWVVSYDGKDSEHLSSFKQAVDILVEAFNLIRKTPYYAQKYEETLSEQGDPMDTGVGFPLYSAEIDAEGRPISKIKVLAQYEDICKGVSTWDELLKNVADRGRDEFEKKYLFAIAPIRRIQAGYKWLIRWTRTSSGYKIKDEYQGGATNRVAWMASYLQNLLISPIQTEWKTYRKIIPGLYFDGKSKTELLAAIRKHRPKFVESDFSGYDRTIPNNVMTYFFEQFAATLPPDKRDFFLGALKQTNSNLPVIWGDAGNVNRKSGWVFQVSKLALLSGLKVTSEIGTFMNLIINISGWLETGFMTKDQILSYLTHFTRTNGSLDATIPYPPLLILGDDTLLMHTEPARLDKLAAGFVSGSERAGIKSQLQPGDKFLMRHMTDGIDRPVLARIWQNSVSNETPVEDPVKFLVGLAMRTDGVAGWKTFDPFHTGKDRGASAFEIKLGILVFSRLKMQFATAKEPLSAAIEFIDVMIDGLKKARIAGDGLYHFHADSGAVLDRKRKSFLAALAAKEVESIRAKTVSDLRNLAGTELYRLHKDMASPSAEAILEILKNSDAGTRSVIETISKKENSFYVLAMRRIGLDPRLR